MGSSALVDAVCRDFTQGIWSIPVAAGSKRPAASGWLRARILPDEAAREFGACVARGRLLGVVGPGGQPPCVVVDLDTPEARRLAAAILPPTGEIAGRASAPAAHWYYRCTSPPRTRRFNDASGRRLLDLLSVGSQVLAPPSVHPSGERYEWCASGCPAHVDPELLLEACEALARACRVLRGETLAPARAPMHRAFTSS
jgi:hypothetical protein